MLELLSTKQNVFCDDANYAGVTLLIKHDEFDMLKIRGRKACLLRAIHRRNVDSTFRLRREQRKLDLPRTATLKLLRIYG